MKTLTNNQDVAIIFRGIRQEVRVRDYGDEGVFLMSYGCALKDCYTAEDEARQRAIEAASPVRDGEEVSYNGKRYTVKFRKYRCADQAQLVAA